MAKILTAAALLAALLGAAPATPAAIQWPEAPAQARLSYLTEIAGAPERAEPTGLGRVLRFLLGIGAAGGRGERGLLQPTGLFARDGVILVADPGARGVFRHDEKLGKGEWLRTGRGLRLISPVAVAAAPDGRVFVADSALAKVFVLDAHGKPSGELRGDPEGMGRPVSLALAEDRLFVSDVSRHRVSAYDLTGLFLFSFGRRGAGQGEFNFPTYLWYDLKAGRLWVCDSGNFRVQSFGPEGSFAGAFGENGDRPGYLARPRGLALDSDGNVYSVDGAMEALQVFDGAGRLLLFVGREGRQPGEFSLPGGVFVDEKDRVLVADTHNGRVQVFQYLKGGKGL